MVELGLSWHDNLGVTDNRIRWILLNKSVYPTYYWPDFGDRQVIWQTMFTEDPYGYYVSDSGGTSWYADVRMVKWRFDLATQYKDRAWTHGVFLLREELWHPATSVKQDLRKWKYIDGSIVLYGQTIEGLKDWYIRTKGSWNQAWWDDVKSNNRKTDSTLWSWSTEYAGKLYKAWHLHMIALGKKSAIIGLITADVRYPVTQLLNYSYGSTAAAYIPNYDFVLNSLFITCVSGCERNVDQSRRIVEEIKAIFPNNVFWLLTIAWEDGAGTADKTVQFEEYKAVLPHADIIGLIAYSNRRTSPYSEPSEPRLLEFCTNTNSCPGTVPCPTPICGFKTEVV